MQKKRPANHEIETLFLKKDESFYLPFKEGETVEKVTFKKKELVYKISVVEEFKEITRGVTQSDNAIVIIPIKTKCLVIMVNKEVGIEILTSK
ncbi:hypothetical protein [Tenacibaculum maritimum]|uniref:hypothetical protein n=1 Tax=Tenacibaculum maritimum TaxID=107401 RepID=UPI0012E57870|nr:hypothetical protein [Tenacibaculum maritimum]CAA0158006.1 hypothetical protein FS0810_100086 [Tenacibaculum maritimum]